MNSTPPLAPRPSPLAPRICFVAPFGLGQKTTIWARTLPLAQVLANQGAEVRILIPPWDTPTDAGKSWVDGGVTLSNVTLAGGTAAITYRLLRELHAFQPHVVHIVKPRAHAGLVQWWLWQRRRWQKTRTPILLDIDDWEQAWAPINHYSPPVARFLAWQEEWGIRHADGITAASRWLVERAHAYAPLTPLQYLPNGVAPAESEGLRWQINSSTDVLFFTRFVEVQADWLAAFWQALRAIEPHARLIVAGTPVQPGLDEPFKRQLTAGDVEWLGYVQPADQSALYARIGCAIFPAADVPLQQAKCSVRLATTLLRGVPVVASAVGEQAAYGADGAARLLGPNASPQEFAQAVAAVLQQPQEQLALSVAARRRLVERYRWEDLGRRLVDFYTKLISS